MFIHTAVVEISRGNGDEVFFFWSLDMEIAGILSEDSLNIHNCCKARNKDNRMKKVTSGDKSARA